MIEMLIAVLAGAVSTLVSPAGPRNWAVRNHLTGERVSGYSHGEAVDAMERMNAEHPNRPFHVWRGPDPCNVLMPGETLTVRIYAEGGQ